MATDSVPATRGSDQRRCHCGQTFKTSPGSDRVHCSRECYSAAQRQRADLRASARFWSKVEKGDGCWNWIGTLSAKGYGIFTLGDHRLNTSAHRWAWVEAHGPIADGLFVCHHCDNPSCVRPEHLFLGTNGDNMRDCAQKGRLAVQKRPWTSRLAKPCASRQPGEANNNSKLTEAQVLEIRALAAKGVPLRCIGRLRGLGFTNIWRIVHRRAWVHLP